MKSYIRKGIVLTAICLLPSVATAKTTLVQEYDFGLAGPTCEGPNCGKPTANCSSYPYTCTEEGLKGSGQSCYDSQKRKSFYKKCECKKGWIPSSDVLLNNGNGEYYAINGGNLEDGDNTSNKVNLTPASDGGVTCYKKEYIHCADNYVEYTGNSLSDPSIITTPVTTTTIGSNICVKYNFVPLLSDSYKNDNILCLSGYSCNTAAGCYNSENAILNNSVTSCFETGIIYGDKSINGQAPKCYSVQRCKTSGDCGTSKPATGFTYTNETLTSVDINDSSLGRSITCYKATGCINQWLITDTSNPDAYKVMYTSTSTYPSVTGSHKGSNISSMGRNCTRWTGCNTADGWQEYARGVGSSQKSAAVVAAAYENNIAYTVSVLSAGTEENMHYFICRRPLTVICPIGSYNDECSSNNSCSWIRLFLPD